MPTKCILFNLGWIMVSQWTKTEDGYVWGNFRIQTVPNGEKPRWKIVHEDRVITVLEDLLDSMNYCERLAGRFKQPRPTDVHS